MKVTRLANACRPEIFSKSRQRARTTWATRLTCSNWKVIEIRKRPNCHIHCCSLDTSTSQCCLETRPTCSGTRTSSATTRKTQPWRTNSCGRWSSSRAKGRSTATAPTDTWTLCSTGQRRYQTTSSCPGASTSGRHTIDQLKFLI